MINIKITDGTTNNCEITDEHGNQIDNVVRIEILPLVRNETVKARITFESVNLDLQEVHLINSVEASKGVKIKETDPPLSFINKYELNCKDSDMKGND